MTALRIVFMGTPVFAREIVNRLYEAGREIVAVYCQPDKPKGRGKSMLPPPVKEWALEKGIAVYQPENFKGQEAREELTALRPDVLVVAAYGLILPQAVLDIPRLGAYNAHGSLLPKYRGAAPIQRALMDGEKMTGTTIMKMEAGMDTGQVLLQQAIPLTGMENNGDLFQMLAEQGGNLMLGALNMLEEGRAAFIPQNDTLATYAPKLRREEEFVPWDKGAEGVHNHIRGLNPEPGARSVWQPNEEAKEKTASKPGNVADGEAIAVGIGAGIVLSGENTGQGVGSIVEFDKAKGCLVVQTGKGLYGITQIKPAGKGMMGAADFYNGYAKKKSLGIFMLPQMLKERA